MLAHWADKPVDPLLCLEDQHLAGKVEGGRRSMDKEWWSDDEKQYLVPIENSSVSVRLLP